MQTDHTVPTINTIAMRQHCKRFMSGDISRKRDRHDLICVICHAPAMGYNFDQITCESCKAFFRRNALHNADKFKCRAGTGDCLVTVETRKRCKYCRLKKCFEKGLRKEWIMSEEEKRTKKQKIEDNRRLRAMSQNSTTLMSSPAVPEPISFASSVGYDDDVKEEAFDQNDDHEDEEEEEEEEHENHDDDPLPLFLTDDEQTHLLQIKDCYSQAIRLNVSVVEGFNHPCLRNLGDILDLINEAAQTTSLRMITFCKLLPEFNNLHEDDRLALIKHNLISALYIHACICIDTRTELFHEPNTPNDFVYRTSVLRFYSDTVYRQTITLVRDVQETLSSDHLALKLLILIVIFSKGIDSNEPNLVYPRQVLEAQNVFVHLLWRYLTERYGSTKTPDIFMRLIYHCMTAQEIARATKESLNNKNIDNDDLAPLMQAVLQIS